MVSTRRPGRLGRLILKGPVLLYNWHVGFLLGQRFLLVNHVGRRSGRPYRTVVEVIGRGGNRWYVMSGFGRGSDWYLNVKAAGSAQGRVGGGLWKAAGSAEVRVGRRGCTVRVRELGSAAAAAVLSDYERRNRFLGGVVRRALS